MRPQTSIPSFVRQDHLDFVGIGDHLNAFNRFGLTPFHILGPEDRRRREARVRLLTAQGEELRRQEGGEA
jgi:hypothetical protein